jgi:hypothetical protein
MCSGGCGQNSAKTKEQYLRFKVWYVPEKGEAPVDEEIIVNADNFIGLNQNTLFLRETMTAGTYLIKAKHEDCFIRRRYITPEEAESIIAKLNIL